MESGQQHLTAGRKEPNMTRRETRFEVSRRQFLGMAGLATGGVLLGACGDDDGGGDGGTAETNADGVPQSPIATVRLGYNNPNPTLRAPIFVGQTMGFFEEVGITSIDVNDADDPIAPTIAGSYDVALYDSDVLFDFNENEAEGESIGLKMISINLGAQPLIMIAREGVTADDLGGKIVGGGREGQVNEAFAKFMLQELGYNWETDVDFRNLTGGSNDWVTAMLSGQVDATIAFPRHIFVVEPEGGTALYQDSLPFPQGGFGMTQKSMDDNPGLAAAWNYAYIKSQRYVKTQSNAEEVRRIITEDWGFDYPDPHFQAYPIASGIMSQDLGFDPNEMEALMDFVSPFGNVPTDINDRWRDYMDLSGLFQAQEALDIAQNPNNDISSGQELVENF